MKNWGGQAVVPRSLALVFIDGDSRHECLIDCPASWLAAYASCADTLNLTDRSLYMRGIM